MCVFHTQWYTYGVISTNLGKCASCKHCEDKTLKNKAKTAYINVE